MRVATPPPRPVMIFDGDCNFCRRWIRRWKHATGERVEYVAYQQLGRRFAEIPRERFERSVQLVEPDGTVYEGAEAVFRSLDRQRLYALPGVAPLSEWVYRLVARNRRFFSTLTRWLWGPDVEPVRHGLVRWLFLRGLGVMYLIAFASLSVQIKGLVGQNGILPAEQLMEAARQQLPAGLRRFHVLPTLCWLGASDAFLSFLCGAGVVLSALLVAGVAPVPVLGLLWLLYLSLAVVCREFLSFQWDALLLESGLLAIFFAPLRWWDRPSRAREPAAVSLWLLRLLVFKLMFCSGVVKLSSGDATWRGLTALVVHYETQPLPAWTSWYAHQLPAWFQKFSCAVMFGIELGLPVLIFAPRRLRLVACGGLVFLQVLILLTGNYSFFNWLSIVLCVTLLDDGVLRRFFGRRGAESGRGRARGWSAWLFAPLAAVYVLLCAVQIVGSFRVRVNWPQPVVRLYGWVAPFRSVNGYGLFAVMTTSRPEIVVEGSHDGLTWRAYEFRYKPGDPMRRPGFVAPHQPRLDWQMWFAALGSCEGNPWFINFCVRLLQGQPEVLALLGENPFADGPPRYVRAMLYDYRFTDFATRRATGAWWRRELKGQYCPVFSLQEGSRR